MTNGAGYTAFGMYELIERLAVGGMAEIYLAREAGAAGDEFLVLKRILPNFAADQQLVDMFLDEQRVAATLRHKNIVRTYDVGEVDGDYFISMEYLQGQDVRRLSRTLKRRRMDMPLELTLTIIAGAAAGLQYAHDKKGVNLQPLDIVHRDVTPHNLFVTYDGVVKLLDFGVAKAANRLVQTTVGTIKGKIPYMSPEQCKGLDIDRRSDIYTLGVVLYELTCGIRLYRARGAEFETMKRIVEEPVTRPSARRANYPRSLERIVLTAMAKNPSDRYQNAATFREDIEAFARAEGLSLSTDRLSHYMHNLFRDNIAALREAGTDATKLMAQLAANYREADNDDNSDSLPSGDFIYSMDWSSSGSQGGYPPSRVGTDHSPPGFRHIGRALSGSVQDVWGAVDPSERRRRSPSGGYPNVSLTPPAVPVIIMPTKTGANSNANVHRVAEKSAVPTGRSDKTAEQKASQEPASEQTEVDTTAVPRHIDRALETIQPQQPATEAAAPETKKTRKMRHFWLWFALVVVGTIIATWLSNKI
ncbi:MAG: protein kinase [Proteobacteria bacterium]|nr:protein kinase [Pseudomonadota bacterium]